MQDEKKKMNAVAKEEKGEEREDSNVVLALVLHRFPSTLNKKFRVSNPTTQAGVEGNAHGLSSPPTCEPPGLVRCDSAKLS